MTKEFGEIEKTQVELKSYEETQIEWRIHDFLSFAESGKFVHSPKFSAGNDSSLLFKLWPKSSVYPEFMSLSLQAEKREHALEFKFGLKRSDGSGLNFVPEILKGAKSNSIPTIRLSKLLSKKSELVPGNVLTVTCTLRREIGSNGTNSLTLIRLDRLSENFKDLFGDKETCDTTLKVKDKVYKVHKAVLMARSPVFAAAFKHDTTEKRTGVITMPDCDPDSFQEFLYYLYSGRLEAISFPGALNLYATSDKYDVPELKKFCVKYLMQCLTVENLCEIVIFADKYDETELFSKVQDFFNKNLCKIFETSEWENFMGRDRRLANKLLKEMAKVRN